MKTLVIGESGQLARALQKALPSAQFWGLDQINWDNPEGVADKVTKAAPNIIVNATAYTAVDQAQVEPQAAWAVNVEGPRILATAASEIGAKLIHVSTDYVFDGKSETDYADSDPTNPINVYGATKLAGELAVAALCPDHFTIRTSWVFSDNGNNFVLTMLRLAEQRDALSVVNDQIGRPTFAGDLAEAIVRVCQTNKLKPGTYHLSGGDACSWYDFAAEIFRQALDRKLLTRVPELTAIATSQYPTPAARPMRSVLAPSNGLTDIMNSHPDWKAGLATVLDNLKN
ncbi:MAG: dTDP-4-dehydrorhamnose reductase [bacterium]